MRDVYELVSSQWLPRAREEVFVFFADARNLERITPPFLKFRVLTSGPIVMRPGTLIDYRLSLHGLPLHWRSEITRWEPPRLFADEQRRGPYAQWTHTHSFEAQDGGTLVKDTVRYRLPGPDLLTRLVNTLFVAPDTRTIFEYRHRAIEDLFGVKGQTQTNAVTITRARL